MAKNLNVLAYDLGSSGGKVVRCRYSGERLHLDTIHQFPNRPMRVHGSDFWDILRIHGGAMHGLRRALSDTPEILSIGFSTWGVDYGLLDSSGKLMNLVHSYRDNRTEGLYQRVFEILPQDFIYKTTGIMFIRFNTIVQLYADLISQPYLMDNADAMLLMPDLFTYLFTRQIASEVTISSTTQMVNPATLSWALELPEALGIPTRILQPIVHPGKVVGAITSENAEIAGASRPINVVAVGGHDTASAIAAAPIGDPSRTAFISAGTWSLLGMELDEPVLTDAAFRANFTNEVGVGNKIAFHKIIAGMWLLQGLKLGWEREGRHLSHEGMARAAARAAKFAFVFDPDDERLMNPLSMIDAISECVHSAGDPKPSSVGEFVRAVYECLALDYRYEIEALERVTGHTVETISIVGGGSRAELLCQMVADATGREVMAGPAAAAEKYRIAVVVKIAGIPWFNRMEDGVRDAAKDLGVDAYQIGPSEADPAQQVKMVEDLIAKKVDAICVVPNDAAALEPVFRKARDRGIIVLTHESPDQKGADWDVETIDSKRFGEMNFEALAQYMGGKGEFAVFVGGLTVPLHNYWADVGLEYAKKNYPDMKLVTDRIPCGESAELAFQRTLELLKAYPNLKGIVGFGSLGPIGASQALEQKKMGGKVSIVGTVIPSHAAKYLKQGLMQKGYLWDPADAAYAMVAVAKKMLEGAQIKTGLELPRLGPVEVDQQARVIKCDAILDITKDNADKLGF